MRIAVKRQSGFTLIELLVSLGLLAAAGTAFMFALNTSNRATSTVDAEVQASASLRSQLEQIKNTAYNTTVDCYPDCYAATVSVPPGFGLTVTAQKVTSGLLGELCVVGANCLQKITVAVSRNGAPFLTASMYKKR